MSKAEEGGKKKKPKAEKGYIESYGFYTKDFDESHYETPPIRNPTLIDHKGELDWHFEDSIDTLKKLIQ
jgi:hypothetical protein